MGRAKPEWVEFARKEFTVSSHSVVTHLFEHIDAIELELKISKEDEERIAKAAERMTENIAQLQIRLNNSNEMVKDQTDRADFLEQERQRLQGEVFTISAENGKLQNKLNIGRELAEEYVQHIDQLKIKLHNANLENTGLKSEADRYRGEIRTLRDLVDEKATEPKKVVLPEEVAEAIEYYRSPQMNYSLQSFARIMFRFSENGDNQWTITLKNFVHKDGKGDVLMQALVNGYTVEQTKENRLREGMLGIYTEWAAESKPLKFGGELCDKLIAFVTKFNAEN